MAKSKKQSKMGTNTQEMIWLYREIRQEICSLQERKTKPESENEEEENKREGNQNLLQIPTKR